MTVPEITKTEKKRWAQITKVHGWENENKTWVEADIMRCKGCGTLGISINHYRITNHKCAGAWDTVKTFDVEAIVVRESIKRVKNYKKARPKGMVIKK